MASSIEMIETVAAALGEMTDEFVLVGGSAVPLLLSDPAVQDIRPTEDVDLVTDVQTRAKHDELEERLRRRGFKHVTDPSAPIIRWRVAGVTVDVMPTVESVLGFSNRWYREGVPLAKSLALPSGASIRVLDSPHFLAAKIEAFRSRGNHDFILSPDIEDLITVIDGRAELASEVGQAPHSAREFITHALSNFADEEGFRSAILGYLPPDDVGQSRFSVIMGRIRRITAH